MRTRIRTPRAAGRYFCSLCGVRTDGSHFDEGAVPSDKHCPVCGQTGCPTHCPPFRTYCPACCGESPDAVRTTDELRLLRTNPYLVGCDACLRRLERTLKDAPLPVYLAHYLHRQGLDIDEAIRQAEALCG